MVQHRRHHVFADPDLVLEGVADAATIGHGGEIDRIEPGGRDVDQAEPRSRRQRGIEVDAHQDLGLGERPERALVDLAMIDRRDIGGGAEAMAQDLAFPALRQGR